MVWSHVDGQVPERNISRYNNNNKKKGTETVQWNEMDPRGRITSSWRDDEFLMRIQSNTIQGDPLRRFIAATIEPSDRIQPFPIKHP